MFYRYYLSRSANLPSGVYILPMFFPYFCIFFSHRLSRPGILESKGPIFTNISGSVEGWKGLLIQFITLRSLKGRCHGTN